MYRDKPMITIRQFLRFVLNYMAACWAVRCGRVAEFNTTHAGKILIVREQK